MNRLFLRSLLSFVIWMVVCSLNAQHINKEVALQKAQAFLSKNVDSYQSARRAPRHAPRLVLANDATELYIFNDEANGGYVVVSGDERMPDVLGYSYDDHYVEGNVPCNMRAWLDEYANQIKYLQAHPEAQVSTRSGVYRENVNRMLTCSWNQSYPYNLKCPEIDGVHCPTGCVATAMAMIMYYHKWPEQTTDMIPGYTAYTGVTVADIPVTTIDWENILDRYPYNMPEYGKYTPAQEDAISTLMLLCGASVNMIYDKSESGSFSSRAAEAFPRFFDYDYDISHVWRYNYNDDDWEELIYNELSHGRPVMYGGHKSGGYGHEFVMDGYRDGYFHIEWGTNFYYEQGSYFLLTDVGGWNNDQDAVIGIKPLAPGSPKEYAVLENEKLTFYCDLNKDKRSGKILPYVIYFWQNSTDFYNKYPEVTECEFDSSFKNFKLRSLNSFFSGSNLKTIKGLEYLNTSNVRSMGSMFLGCTSLTDVDLSGLNTDNVRDMSGMFASCYSLKELDLSGFNTENVTDMSRMFTGCAFQNLDLSSFNTASVTDMQGMFGGCTALISLNLSDFNTGNVTDMSDMFQNCYSLTTLNLSGFNTEKVTNMGSMFENCYALTNLDLSSFHTDNVTNMARMFMSCRSLETLDVPYFSTTNVTDMAAMFYGCGAKALDLSSFRGNSLKTMESMFYNCGRLESLDVSNLNTPNVTNMDGIFSGCSSLKSLDLSCFRTDSVSDMNGMFGYCYALESLDVSNFNTSNVTDMCKMFYWCNSLKKLDLSSFRTENVTNMSEMFVGCEDLEILDISHFSTPKVKDMLRMFGYCKKLKSLDLNGFNTANVTNMSGMFEFCYNLTDLDLDSFVTDSVTDMSSMFSQCSRLQKLDVSHFNTENVTDMSHMFDFCSTLKALDLSNFNTSKVTNMNRMFYTCYALDSLDISNFDTSNVKNMGYMFCGCYELKELDLSSFNTENVTNMDYLFADDGKLSSIYVSESWDVGNVETAQKLFGGCEELKGGQGTVYSNVNDGLEYAHIDGGPNNPGYFTYKKFTGIQQIDAKGDVFPSVYSLSGTKVRTEGMGTKGLPAGIYIVEGKKMVGR